MLIRSDHANIEIVVSLNLCETKVFASSGYGHENLLSENVIALVFREVKLVEACVLAWKSILVAIVTMDVESTETIHALKFLETVEGDLASAGDKLK